MSKLTKIDEARAKSNVERLSRPMKGAPPAIKMGSELHQAQRVCEGLGISAQELCESFGTTSPQFAACELVRLMSNFPEDVREQYANAALAMIHNLKPKNEVEFLLATQMYATHVAATDLLRQASQSEFAANTAIKLLRTFAAQTEALAKMRRGENKQ